MEIDHKKKGQFFTRQLLQWAKKVNRPMPWKGEKNPYLIWLSEIILQQTRVEQGLPYFLKFKEKYPSVHELAHASEDEVMKLWEGLGYYSRARNLHSTAKFISKKLDGKFPNIYEDILALKGVGGYTAAAIASFAYDLPYAVLDGNVFRVLARYFGIKTPVDTTEGKKFFATLTSELLDKKHPAIYNQGIMDFGAIQCTAKNPKCINCILKNNCTAFFENTVSLFPVKSKRIEKKTRYFNYLVINYDDSVLLQKRTKKDIWQNLYEFPLIETEKVIRKNILLKNSVWKDCIGNQEYKVLNISHPRRQTLTHRKIVATFFEIEVARNFLSEKNNYVKTKRKNLSKFAFPKIIDLYLCDNSLNLYPSLDDL